jgi:transcriptional regulator with XRE-family HTH domain
MGSTLKALRERAGLTQAQLAQRAGVPLGSVRSYEQAVRTPLLDTAARLAVALGVSIDVLAGLAEAPAPKRKGGKS